MKKILVFDMDGTIADFYGVPNWETDLLNGNVRPYVEAKPLYDMDELNVILNEFHLLGWIIIVTWSPKGGTKRCPPSRRPLGITGWNPAPLWRMRRQ